jgi:hypothetical protein
LKVLRADGVVGVLPEGARGSGDAAERVRDRLAALVAELDDFRNRSVSGEAK